MSFEDKYEDECIERGYIASETALSMLKEADNKIHKLQDQLAFKSAGYKTIDEIDESFKTREKAINAHVKEMKDQFSEWDPDGKEPDQEGAKLDHGKPRCSLVLGAFANALLKVSEVGTFGAEKYSDNGWLSVENGQERYDDAKIRHWLYEKAGRELDQQSNLLHAAHEAWNALARLELMLRNKSV